MWSRYEQLTLRANALREELHTEIETMLNDIIKFKMHIQKNLEGYEGFVADELEKELGTPAGRAGADTDMGATILMLAGKGGVFYNGQILYPDGGESSIFSVPRGFLADHRIGASLVSPAIAN